MNRRKTHCILFLVCICMALLFTQISKAVSFYTDYQGKVLNAESGVSLKLSKGVGIASVEQQGYCFEEDGVGWYRAGDFAQIDAGVEPGYRFYGWYENEVQVSADACTDFSVEGYTSLAARAELIEYTVTFHAYGGTLQGDIPLSYTVASGELMLPEPSKEGAVFDGWYESESFEGEPIRSIPPGSTGDKVFHAKWIEENCERDYALILDHPADADNLTPMIFVSTDRELSAGDIYQSKTYGALKIKFVYTDFVDTDIDAVSDIHEEKVAQIPWVEQSQNVTSVCVEDSISPVSTAFWFYTFQNCKSVDVSKVNTERLTNTCFNFYDTGSKCTSFSIRGLSQWDVSKVTNMESMFENAGYYGASFDLGELDTWDVSKVENMKSMFRDTGYKAKQWNVGSLDTWDTSSVQQMAYMFYNAGRSAETFSLGNLGAWDISGVDSLQRMFYYAGYAATTYSIGDLSAWNVSTVENMEGLFYGSGYSASSWSIGDLSGWDVGNVNTMAMMFGRTGRKTKSWSVGNLGAWNVERVEKMQNMFDGAGYSATSFYLGNLANWKTENVTNMSSMFYNAGYNAAWLLDCSGWNVKKVTAHTNFNRNVTTKVLEPAWN